MEQSQKKKDEFNNLIKELQPKSEIVKNCVRAFLVGGTICTIGQIINNLLNNYGLTDDKAGMITTIILIFSGILLTGFGLYEKLGNFAGAGSIIPITGFANAVASPAIEFKKEGYVYGIGAKMFIIAGPVIVYGTVTSMLIGFIYYLIEYVI